MFTPACLLKKKKKKKAFTSTTALRLFSPTFLCRMPHHQRCPDRFWAQEGSTPAAGRAVVVCSKTAGAEWPATAPSSGAPLCRARGGPGCGTAPSQAERGGSGGARGRSSASRASAFLFFFFFKFNFTLFLNAFILPCHPEAECLLSPPGTGEGRRAHRIHPAESKRLAGRHSGGAAAPRVRRGGWGGSAERGDAVRALLSDRRSSLLGASGHRPRGGGARTRLRGGTWRVPEPGLLRVVALDAFAGGWSGVLFALVCLFVFLKPSVVLDNRCRWVFQFPKPLSTPPPPRHRSL